MLKKLLKYDFKSMFNFWWIASIISLLLSLLGAFCIRVISSDRSFPPLLTFFSVISLIISVIGVTVFIIFSVVMIYTRFYKNFFTDEGYLTFTLPVTRIQLLNSKIISGLLIEILTSLVCILDFALIIGIGFHEYIFTEELARILNRFFAEVWNTIGLYSIIYTLELIVISILSIVISIIFTFICITVASIIARKAKVLLAVIIYYIINSAVASATQTMSFLATPFLEWIGNVPDTHAKIIVLVGLLTLIFAEVFICCILYSIEYRMIDKKLNLS